MLTAITKNGYRMNLLDHYERSALLELKYDQIFFCPDCKDKLILKVGEYKIPHFAHYHGSACIAASEPESLLHIQGKADLYHWLQNQQLNVVVESYIPEIKQRADLYFSKNGVQYAIEYQCSPITNALLQSRTEGYKSVNITPVWILGGTPYKRKIKHYNKGYQLSDFHWNFVKYNKKLGLYLISYQPNSKEILLLSNITTLTSGKILANLTSSKLSTYNFPLYHSYSPPNNLFVYSSWFIEKNKWLQQKMVFAKSLNDPLLASIYHEGLTPLLLPPEIGLPVELNGLCRSHPVVWQYFVWKDVIQKLKRGDRFSFLQMQEAMKRREKLGHIHFRNIPFVDEKLKNQMVYQYLIILKKLEYIREERKGQFKMNKSIPIPNNIEDVKKYEKNMKIRLEKFRN